MSRFLLFVVLIPATCAGVDAQSRSGARPRARELGISALIGGTPGRLDAITDCASVPYPRDRLLAALRKYNALK